jgi:hypothetical protein
MPPVVTGPWALVALRKAAVMTHWIPDLGVVVHQAGRPSIRVAGWSGANRSRHVELHPCEFRRAVVAHLTEDRCGLRDLLSPERNTRLEWFTGPQTQLGPIGVVRHLGLEGHEVLAVPTVLDGASVTAVGLASGALPEAPGRPGCNADARSVDWIRLDYAGDEELSATMVYATVPDCDADARDRAFDVISTAHGALAAEEAARSLHTLQRH